MVDGGGHRGLAPEALAEAGVVVRCGAMTLSATSRDEPLLVRAVDDAHAAAAEHAVDR